MMATWRCVVCTYVNTSTDLCECCKISRCDTTEESTLDRNYQIQLPEYTGIDDRALKIIHDIANFERIIITGYTPSLYNLKLALSDIMCYNNNIRLVTTLKNVIKRLLTYDPRNRALDLTNPKVMDRFLQHDGIMQFLSLMGYTLNPQNTKLSGTQRIKKEFIQKVVSMLIDVTKKFDYLRLADLMDANSDKINSESLDRLLYSYKLYTDSFTLFDIFKRKFFVQIPMELIRNENPLHRDALIEQYRIDVQRKKQLQIAKTLRDWVKHYWMEDFYYNIKLQQLYEEWLRNIYFYSGLDHNLNLKWLPTLCDIISSEYFKQKSNNGFDSESYTLQLDDTCMDYDMTQHTTQEIADQITLMQHCAFCRIKPREYVYNILLFQNDKECSNISFCNETLLYKLCYHMHNAVLCLDNQSIMKIVSRWYGNVPNDIVPEVSKFYKGINEPLSQHLLVFAKEFNGFVRYIQMVILRQKTLKGKMKKIRKIMIMGERFQKRRNYHALCAVFSALNSHQIKGFESIWKRLISEKRLQKIAEWTVLFDAKNRNYRNLRNHLLTTDLSNKPWIPHVGMLLLDSMSINNEICKLCNYKMCQCNVNDDERTSFCTLRKCMRIADRIKHFDGNQMAKYSEIKPQKSLQKVLFIEMNRLHPKYDIL